MPYWRLFYHIVWATKDRQPSIRQELGLSLRNHIADKAACLGAIVHAVGGIENHIHVAVSVPPSIALSEFVRQLKGASSHFMNHEFPMSAPFSWQADYGVMSFDARQLDKIVHYIKDQQQRHANGTTIQSLERQAEQEYDR